MRTVIKTGLTALSLALLATQASATELQKHPDEDKGHIQSGIIFGEITETSKSKGIITRSTTFNATVSSGKSSNTYRIDTANLFSQIESISKAESNSAIVSYVTHTAIGDVTMGDSYLPTFIPFFSTHSGSFGTNNLELTGLVETKPFDQSLSASHAGQIIQDNTVTAEEADEISGPIISVTRHFGPARPLATDRSCLITVLDEDEDDNITVKTLTEEMCQFAEDAALAREKVVVKYDFATKDLSHPTLVSIGLVSVPAETTPVGHDGQPIIAHILSQPRDKYGMLNFLGEALTGNIGEALTGNIGEVYSGRLVEALEFAKDLVSPTDKTTTSTSSATLSAASSTVVSSEADQNTDEASTKQELVTDKQTEAAAHIATEQEEASRIAIEQEEANRIAIKATEKQPHEKRKKKSKYKG